MGGIVTGKLTKELNTSGASHSEGCVKSTGSQEEHFKSTIRTKNTAYLNESKAPKNSTASKLAIGPASNSSVFKSVLTPRTDQVSSHQLLSNTAVNLAKYKSSINSTTCKLAIDPPKSTKASNPSKKTSSLTPYSDQVASHQLLSLTAVNLASLRPR